MKSLKSSVTETITSIKSVRKNGCQSKIKAAKSTLFCGGFTATGKKIRNVNGFGSTYKLHDLSRRVPKSADSLLMKYYVSRTQT